MSTFKEVPKEEKKMWKKYGRQDEHEGSTAVSAEQKKELQYTVYV